ncbi:hypothetical protein DXG01_016909 [Tephrocybe rancida]|nr:hypothetical protein DXG01_016909 [Tephrocybe rancida]
MKGSPISMVLDVIEVPKSHTGKALARMFVDVLESFGIKDKHFDPPKKKTGGDTEVGGDTDPEEDALFAMEVEAAMEELLMASKDFGGEEDEKLDNDNGSTPVPQLHRLAFKMINSTTLLLPARKAKLDELELKRRLMPRDIRTRWNSTFDMLTFALEYQEAIQEFTKDCDNKLCDLELSSSKWDLVEELAKTLKPLKDATLLFSKGTPNLPYVIPVMDRIDTLFTDTLHSTTNPALCAAIKSGKTTLNQYYSRTDEVEIFRISMILHPRHKVTYFKNAGWQINWINSAHELVQDEFSRTYADFKGAVSDPELDQGIEDSDDEVEIVQGPSAKKSKSTVEDNIFADLFEAPVSVPIMSMIDDKLVHYLSTPIENVTDGLKWWYQQRGK